MTKAQIAKELNDDVKKISLELLRIKGRIESIRDQKRAQTKAAAPLVSKMVQDAPSKSLSESIDVFDFGRSRSTFVGPNYKKGGRLAWIFEYGTIDRFKKSGQYTGMMEKKPFVKPAYNATRIEVLSRLKKEYEKLINESIKK